MPFHARAVRIVLWPIICLLAALPLSALAQEGPRTERLKQLLSDLKSDNPDTRHEAARGLMVMGPQASAAAEDLIRALRKDTEQHVRAQIVRALARIGAEPATIIPPLLEVLAGDRDVNTRMYAADALGSLGEAAAPAVTGLVGALSDREPAVRRAAANALASARQAGSVSGLAAALKDPDDSVRDRAARALGAIGPDAKPAVSALMTALTDASAEVRTAAARALGNIGPGAATAVAPLTAMLKDADSFARNAACFALGRLGEAATSAGPALIEMLNSGVEDTRASAAVALGGIGKPVRTTAVPPLIGALKSGDPNLRAAAAEALGAFLPPSDAAVTGVISLLRDSSVQARYAAICAVREFGPAAKTAERELLRISQRDRVELLQYTAIGALGALGVDMSERVPDLLKLLKTDRAMLARSVRMEVIRATGYVGAVAFEALGPLNDIAEKDPDAEIRDLAVDALRRIRH